MYVLPFVFLSFFFCPFSLRCDMRNTVCTVILSQTSEPVCYGRENTAEESKPEGDWKKKRHMNEKANRREPEASTVPVQTQTWHLGGILAPTADSLWLETRTNPAFGKCPYSFFFFFFFHFQLTVCTTEPKKAEDMKIYKLSAGDGWCLQVQSVCYHHGVGRRHPRTGALSLGFLSYMLQKKFKNPNKTTNRRRQGVCSLSGLNWGDRVLRIQLINMRRSQTTQLLLHNCPIK